MDNKEIIEIAKSVVNDLNFEFPYDIEEWVNEKNMLMENYHKHTTWSDFFQIDSATSLNEFINYSKELGCKYYFSTEHGYPGEWINCYDVCKNNDIGFRYAAEVYWVKDINAVEIEEYKDKKGEIKTREKKDNTNCHMVIIARNYNAIRKLNYIISRANDEGFYYKPRIDLSMLFTLNPEDVYITSSCIAGWKYEDAAEIWYKIWKHFGDSFYLEYQTNNTDEQKALNNKIRAMANEFGINTIIGLDTHYLNDADRVKRDNLLKRKGLHYDDEDGWYMDFPNGRETFERMRLQSVIPPNEIIVSMMNTHRFNTGCEDFEYDTSFKIPIYKDYENMSYEDRCGILRNILNDQYKKEDSNHRNQERIDAIRYEYGEIVGSGTADYFIDNFKVIELATSDKYKGQLTTTSRGSAASYYCSKLLGFTTMDRFEAEVPIYPERFITKDRVLSSHQMPDIDMNCSWQEPFYMAARELFGDYSCYPLLAVGKFGEKSGFKMYADVSGLDPTTANDITTMIDSYNEALKEAEDDEKDMINIEDYITDSNYLKIFNESKPYQGIIEQAKVHACGFTLFNGNPNQKDVIGYGDVRYEFGLIRCHSESTGKSTLVVNIEGGLLDSYGYVKDDFLIVDVVGIINKLYKSIGREVPSVTELRQMVSGDSATWKLYEDGVTCCLNQCEKPGTTQKAKKYKPQNIKELAAFIAGIRPGFKSLINGFLNRVEYTNGEPAIDKLLEECFQYMLYQEAVMKIFTYLGIPMKDSYDTIKKISKKKLKGEALKHVEDTLKEHWMSEIGNLDNFESVYKVIKDSARYSFNAPHALAMANDSLYEAWMKAHHTSKFYEVTLNHYQEKENKNKVADLIKEATSYFGYVMGKYEYGVDNSKFIVDDEKKIIYPNLGSVKGIGEKAVESIYEISKTYGDDFISTYLAIKGTKINGSVFRSLIKIDYFKKFGSAKKLLAIVDLIDSYRANGNEKKKINKDIELPNAAMEYITDILSSGNISKQYTILDWNKFIRALCEDIPNEDFSLSEKIKFQMDILGYFDLPKLDIENKYVVVSNLNTSYSPKFTATALCNGKACEFKVHSKLNARDKSIKNAFSKTPFENGDILYIKSFSKKLKQKKVGDSWEPIPGEFNWWINDYIIVKDVLTRQN